MTPHLEEASVIVIPSQRPHSEPSGDGDLEVIQKPGGEQEIFVVGVVGEHSRS